MTDELERLRAENEALRSALAEAAAQRAEREAGEVARLWRIVARVSCIGQASATGERKTA